MYDNTAAREELERQGYVFIGWHGTTPEAAQNLLRGDKIRYSCLDDPIWNGFYVSNEVTVAAGYPGGVGVLLQAYVHRHDVERVYYSSGPITELQDTINRYRQNRSQRHIVVGLEAEGQPGTEILIGSEIRVRFLPSLHVQTGDKKRFQADPREPVSLDPPRSRRDVTWVNWEQQLEYAREFFDHMHEVQENSGRSDTDIYDPPPPPNDPDRDHDEPNRNSIMKPNISKTRVDHKNNRIITNTKTSNSVYQTIPAPKLTRVPATKSKPSSLSQDQANGRRAASRGCGDSDPPHTNGFPSRRQEKPLHGDGAPPGIDGNQRRPASQISSSRPSDPANQKTPSYETGTPGTQRPPTQSVQPNQGQENRGTHSNPQGEDSRMRTALRTVKQTARQMTRPQVHVGGAGGICNVIDNFDREPEASANFLDAHAGEIKTRTRVGYGARASVGDFEAHASVLGVRASLPNASAGVTVGLDGLNAHASVEVVRAEATAGIATVGVGLSLSTGVSAGPTGVGVSFLGFGVHVGPKMQVKTPIADASVECNMF